MSRVYIILYYIILYYIILYYIILYYIILYFSGPLNNELKYFHVTSHANSTEFGSKFCSRRYV